MTGVCHLDFDFGIILLPANRQRLLSQLYHPFFQTANKSNDYLAAFENAVMAVVR